MLLVSALYTLYYVLYFYPGYNTWLDGTDTGRADCWVWSYPQVCLSIHSAVVQLHQYTDYFQFCFSLTLLTFNSQIQTTIFGNLSVKHLIFQPFLLTMCCYRQSCSLGDTPSGTQPSPQVVRMHVFFYIGEHKHGMIRHVAASATSCVRGPQDAQPPPAVSHQYRSCAPPPCAEVSNSSGGSVLQYIHIF